MVCVAAGVLAVPASAPAAIVSPWSIVPSANTSPSQANGLGSVSCSGPRFCMAVGSYQGPSNQLTLTEMWNGVSWTIVPSPNASTTGPNDLSGVSCTSASSCVAMGGYANGSGNVFTFAESWDGHAWTMLTTVNPSTASGFPTQSLGGVSCTSPTSCTAVGSYTINVNTDQTLVETWNGHTWSVVPSADTSSTNNNFLDGVSCSTPTSCMAVGFVEQAPDQTLAERWNGTTWSIVPTPNASTTSTNDLNAVTCTNPSFCMAVGLNDTGSSPASLIEMWNGTAWSIVSGASTIVPNSDENFLYGVSCIDPSSCVATGHWSNTGDVKDSTLIESWDGTAWSIVPSPNASPTLQDDLNGASCGGGSQCFTVGGTQAGPNQTLIEQAPVKASGYYEVASDGGLFAYHAAFHGSMGGMPLNAPVVGMAYDPATGGYWEVASDGGLFAFNAPFYGSMGGKPLNKPIVGMAYDPATGGYWEVASDGGLFAFNAPFYGSMGGTPLNQPVVGIAALPDGSGYYEVASDGGLFAFNAPFSGSMGGKPLNKPMVGMALDGPTGGYYEVASDGGLFAFNATFNGSMGGKPLNKPMVGMALDGPTGGYYEVASDGGLFAFNATFNGSMGGKPLNKPMVGMAAQPDGSGYWEVASDGGLFAFNAPFLGSTGGMPLNAPVVGMATS
jgi:hypothetical protein